MKSLLLRALVVAVVMALPATSLAQPDARRHMKLVGTSDLFGVPSFTGDVDVDTGRGVAYVGAAFIEKGVTVIDISDPSNPVDVRALDTCFTAPFLCSDSIDVKLEGDLLAVSSEPIDGGAFGGATLYDVSGDPLAPVMRGQFFVDGGTHNLFIDPEFPVRPYVYLANFANTDTVQIIDVSNLDAPFFIAELMPSDEDIGCQDPTACPGQGFGGPFASPHDLFVQVHPDTGRVLAYVAYWDAGLRIYDVTDLPAAPVEIGVFDVDPPPSDPEELPCCVHYAQPTPSGAFVLIEEEVGVGDSGDVRILDATGCDGVAMCTLTLVGSWQPPQGHARQGPSYSAFVETGNLNFGWFQRFFSFDVHNLDVRENEFVAAAYDAGIRLVDITDKANPVEIASFIPVLNVKNAAIGPEFQPAETWTARFGDDGNIYASDFFTGFHVVRPVGPGH